MKRLPPLRFDLTLPPPQQLAFVRSHCRIDEDGCWRWRGRMQRQGYPVFTVARRLYYLRPWVAKMAGNADAHKPSHLMRCGKADCLRPGCIEGVTKGTFNRRAVRGRKRPADAARRATMARRAQTRTKLDLDRAREIRTRVADGESYRRVARDYGVHASAVAAVVTGRIWREPSVWAI